MKRILLMLLCILALNATAQTVTRTQHRAAVTQDAVTTGTMNIRKPDYICISTNSGREQLIMDGTKFTMTVGSKRHVTDSRKDIAVAVKNGKKIITITPAKKRRQMFTSFVLTIDSATSAIKQLRMNERSGNYVNYDIK